MKRIIKYLVPALIFAVLFSLLLFVPTEAKIDRDVTYATWSSEEAYLANPEAPEAVYKTDTLASNAVASAGYVKLFSNMSITSNIQLPVGCNTIIDLGGNKLTTKAKIIVNGSETTKIQKPGKLLIKNGDIVHTGGQFIQGRSNAEIYFDGVDIVVRGGNTFLTAYSFRIMHFNNCNVTVESSGSPTVPVFEVGMGYNPVGADTYNDGADFVTNILFENTYFNDKSSYTSATSFKCNLFSFVESSNNPCFFNISFGYGSGFNRMYENFFKTANTNKKSVIRVNVSKGARFIDPVVPHNSSKFELNYFDSIERVGNTVVFGNPTSLLPEGATQNPDAPKLIFGKSGNDVLPYQLCHTLHNVTWVSKGVATTVEGYADGLYLSYTPETRGNFFNPDDNNLVYEEVHRGWSTTEDGTEFSKTVFIDADATYYAGFERNGPAAIVEFSSAEMREEDIVNAYFNAVIDNNTKAFGDGSYVRLYKDVTLALDTTLVLPVGATVDLGGNSLVRTTPISEGRAVAITVASGSATVKNGTVKVALVPLCAVEAGAQLVFDGADLSYSGAPLAYVTGTLSVVNSTVKERGNSPEIPAIILDGSANVQLSSSSVTTSGVLFTTSVTSGADFELSVTEGTVINALALITMEKSTVDSISAPTSLVFNVEGSEINTNTVFDIPTRTSGLDALEAVFNLSDSRFMADPSASPSGSVKIGTGELLACSDEAKYPYVVNSSSISMSFGMSLLYNMTASFYFPVSGDLVSVTPYYGKLTHDELEIREIDGIKYYACDVPGISCADALNEIPLKIEFLGDDGFLYSSELRYSPVDYFEALLKSPDVLERKLCAAAMNYVMAAYLYTGAYLPEDFVELTDSEEYQSLLRDYSEVPRALDVDMGNISLAFSGAQLYLSDCIAIRFNLKDGFTGSLTISGKNYAVEGGKVGELAYIDIEITSADLYCTSVKITGESNDGEEILGAYSLSAYLDRAPLDNASLNAMLKALYVWCYEAYVTGNGGTLPPNYVDTLPPSGVVWH